MSTSISAKQAPVGLSPQKSRSNFPTSLRELSRSVADSTAMPPGSPQENHESIPEHIVRHFQRFVSDDKSWPLNTKISYDLSVKGFPYLCRILASYFQSRDPNLASAIKEAEVKVIPNASIKTALESVSSSKLDSGNSDQSQIDLAKNVLIELSQDKFGASCMLMTLSLRQGPLLSPTPRILAKTKALPSSSPTTPTNLPTYSREQLENLIPQQDQTYASKDLVRVVIGAESGWNPYAVSKANAKGMMQIDPITAEHLNLSEADLFNPQKNIEAGSKYLASLHRRFKTIELTLAAYNYGPTNLSILINRLNTQEWTKVVGRLPGETQRYVSRVTKAYNALRTQSQQ